MKHTTEKLLLACKLHSLAAKFRSAEIPPKLDGDALSDWLKANPITGYVPQALNRIEEVATVIEQLRKSGAS